MMADLSPIFLTVSEVANTMRVNHDTVRRWLRLGELRGHKIGKSWRVAPSELARFAANSQGSEEHQNETNDLEERLVTAAQRAGYTGNATRLRQEVRRALNED